jgi:hypothetical protein
MARRRRKKSRLLPLAVLLAILAGAGAWNYQRALEAEAATPRPYRGYATADLESLAGAYESELEALRRRAAGTPATRTASGSDRFGEFERVQRQSRAVRSLAREISEREITLAEIERERSQRARESDRLGLFLRRVFSIPS